MFHLPSDIIRKIQEFTDVPNVCKHWKDSIDNISEEKGMEYCYLWDDELDMKKEHMGIRTKHIKFGCSDDVHGEIFIENMLRAENLQSLEMSIFDIYDIHLLDRFHNLISLKIENNARGYNTTHYKIPLKILKQLQILHINCRTSHENLLACLGQEIRELSLYGGKIDFSSIARFQNLQSLIIDCHTANPTYECIINCQTLTCLELSGAPVPLIHMVIENLVNLKKLVINWTTTHLKETLNFEKLVNLEELCVYIHHNIRNVHCLKNLRVLDVCAAFDHHDATSKFNFPNLEILKLENHYYHDQYQPDDEKTWIDLDFLIHSKKLISLSITGFGSKWRGYSQEFQGLTNLRCLHLDIDRFRDFKILENLTELIHLNMDCNRMDSLCPLRGLKKLKKLELKNMNRVENLDDLRELLSLEYLIIDGNGLKVECPCPELCSIMDVTPLSCLRNIRTLSISGLTYVTDVSCLQSLTKLEYINIHNMFMLKSIACFQNLPNLITVSVCKSNQITNEFTAPLQFCCYITECKQFKKSADVFTGGICLENDPCFYCRH
jgi:hypothetical protein